ncbi:TetR/AcrR family transcriptional regulator [Paenibacillus sp. SN-8-1]|uniref:TetR/AcrR family transcriptional regulator n=1 Tax=Paenibacillus sp. SN-8-1 TaxID=3435409 RepID=UPI003D9A9697
MEQLKRRQIMNKAMEVFKDKGYVNASMQDIAEKCGMAKGSIYKLFSSKEELFIAVFEDCHFQMFEQAEELQRKAEREGWSREQLFLRHISFQLEYITDHYFLMMEFKELPIKTNEQFITTRNKKKDFMLRWHRDFILNMYGEQAEACIWDIVMIFRGIMKEYLSLLHQQIIEHPIVEIASFIASRMNAVVTDLSLQNANPILQEFDILSNPDHPQLPEMRRAAIQKLLGAMTKEVQESDKSQAHRQELLEVVTLLGTEYNQPSANPTLIRVYLTFLETASELRTYVRQLKLMIRSEQSK